MEKIKLGGNYCPRCLKPKNQCRCFEESCKDLLPKLKKLDKSADEIAEIALYQNPYLNTMIPGDNYDVWKKGFKAGYESLLNEIKYMLQNKIKDVENNDSIADDLIYSLFSRDEAIYFEDLKTVFKEAYKLALNNFITEKQ